MPGRVNKDLTALWTEVAAQSATETKFRGAFDVSWEFIVQGTLPGVDDHGQYVPALEMVEMDFETGDKLWARKWNQDKALSSVGGYVWTGT